MLHGKQTLETIVSFNCCTTDQLYKKAKQTTGKNGLFYFDSYCSGDQERKTEGAGY